MKSIVICLFMMVLNQAVNAQSVGIGTETPDPSAAVDVTSTTQGMLVPRMSTAQREMITTPAQGLLVFDLSTNSFWFRNSNSWVELVDSVNTEVHRSDVDKIYTGLTDNVGIGNAIPLNKLDILAGTERTGLHSTNRPLYVTGDFGEYGDGIEFMHSNSTQGIGFGFNSIYAAGTNDNQDLKWRAKGPNGSLRFYTNGFERGVIDGSGKISMYGYLGIGNITPQAPLHFGSGMQGRKMIVLQDSNFNSDHEFSGMGLIPGAFNTLAYQVPPTIPNSSQGHIFFAGINELMRITGEGRVGIHHSTPLYPLHFGVDLANPNKIGLDGPGVYGTIGISGVGMFQSTLGTDQNFLINNSLAMQLRQNGNVIVGLQGNLGVGTDSPQEKLHVVGQGYISSLGISILDPVSPLEFFQGAHESKIALARFGANFYGFGTAANVLRYTVPSTGDHVFYATDNNVDTELARVKGNGQVGINIAPNNQLDIHEGAPRSGTHPSGKPLYVTGDIGSASNGIEFRHNNGAEGIGLGYNTIYAAGTNASQNIGFLAKGPGGNLLFSTNSMERFRITGNGNVGIGTINPNAPLQFSNATVNRKIVMYEVGNNEHQFFGFGVNADGSLRYQAPVAANDHVFYAGSSATTSNELMRIRGTGNVDVAGALEIGYIRVFGGNINVDPGMFGSAQCDCPEGTVVIGGGVFSSNSALVQHTSYPNSTTTWYGAVTNNNIFNAYYFQVWAICARLAN